MRCRSIEEFSISDVFKPGENRLADSIVGRFDRAFEEKLLRFVRMEYPSGRAGNRFWGFLDLFDDGELDFSYFEQVEENTTESEINQFVETLVRHGFIRTDNYRASLALAVICGNHIYEAIDRRNLAKNKWFDIENMWSRTLYYAVFNSNLYEVVKPMADEADMAVILGVLKAVLPPRQYEVLGFCLSKGRDCYYTACETEALETAIKNINSDEFVREIISCIVS